MEEFWTAKMDLRRVMRIFTRELSREDQIRFFAKCYFVTQQVFDSGNREQFLLGHVWYTLKFGHSKLRFPRIIFLQTPESIWLLSLISDLVYAALCPCR